MTISLSPQKSFGKSSEQAMTKLSEELSMMEQDIILFVWTTNTGTYIEF
jgi:hypothetical protein